MKFVGERRALAAAILAFYFLFYCVHGVLAAGARVHEGVRGDRRGVWPRVLLAGRRLLLGPLVRRRRRPLRRDHLCASGIWQIGAEPVLLFIGGTHLAATLMLWGGAMSEPYDGQTAWREKFHMDENAVQRLGRSVIRAGVSLPFVLLYAFAPKPDGASMAVSLARARTHRRWLWRARQDEDLGCARARRGGCLDGHAGRRGHGRGRRSGRAASPGTCWCDAAVGDHAVLRADHALGRGALIRSPRSRYRRGMADKRSSGVRVIACLVLALGCDRWLPGAVRRQAREASQSREEEAPRGGARCGHRGQVRRRLQRRLPRTIRPRRPGLRPRSRTSSSAKARPPCRARRRPRIRPRRPS